MLTIKLFRRSLNLAMVISILGTVPYMVNGQTQYRHEVFGITALILIAWHCLENRFWFSKRTFSRAMKFRNWINLLLTVTTLILLISGVMISNVVFRFLGIPYHEFWHYVHFASGAAFLILAAIHGLNHIR